MPSLLLCVPGLAAAADLMQAPACRTALQALSAAEADAAASAPLQAARQRAAVACLGPAAASAVTVAPASGASAPRAAGSSVAVPRPLLGVGRVAPPSPPSPPAAALPRPAPRPPVTVSGCDATGCWASDGSRLSKQGPLLLGPRGACTQTAGVLNCP